ncbi:MAG TPA: hypothetical protein VKY74_24200 [Chloroflexia bacterium]|nr:hypothetical protein [Chloroflexia bacterium]
MHLTPRGRAGAVLLGFVLVAGLFTWPLAAHLTTAIPGDGKDGWMEAWTLWWVALALRSGQNPFHTGLLFHPYGADLYLHTLMPLDGLLTLPVQIVGGPVAAYNAGVFLALATSAWGAYLLARDRLRAAGVAGAGWRGALPALAAGLLFGFSPYMADHLLSHLNLLSAAGIPLTVWALLRAAEADPGAGAPGGPRDRRRRLPWRASGLAALSLGGTALCEWQYILFLALGTGLAGLVLLARRRGGQLVGPALAWGLFLLGMSPIIAGGLQQIGQVSAASVAGFATDVTTYSADLLAYLVPSPFHPWWGAWAAGVLHALPGTLIEKVMFPTYTGLILAGIGLEVGRRRGWPVGGWAAAAAAFLVLSLGPGLQVAGRPLPVPLPGWLLYQLPIANLTRAPGRFVVMVLLAVAVLAAFGLAALLEPAPAAAGRAPAGRRGQGILALLAVGLLGLELWPAPYRLAAWDVPPGEQVLPGLAPGTAVFDIPYGRYESAYLEAQMAHGQPLIGGYLARIPAYPLFEGVPVFTTLQTLDATPDLCAPPIDGRGPGLFAYFGAGALVLHKDKLGPRALAQAEALAARAGLGPPAQEDARLVIYYPPRPATAAPWANLDTPTWYLRESGPDGGLRRWMGATGRIRVWRPDAAAATLTLQLAGFPGARQVAIEVTGQPPQVARVNPVATPLTIVLPPAAGMTLVTLRPLDPPVAPASVGAGTDPRPLSLSLSGCALR